MKFKHLKTVIIITLSILVLFADHSLSAEDPELKISVFTITPDDWEPISIQSGTVSKSYLLKARGGKVFHAAETPALGDAGIYLTIPEEGSLTVIQGISDRGSIIIYLQLIPGGGSEIIELAYTNTK